MSRLKSSVLLLPLLLTAVAVAVVWPVLGMPAAGALVALVVLEIAMAADSSVPMAGIASRIQTPARRLFLSIGLVAGVVLARLALPPLAVATDIGARGAVRNALTQPQAFAMNLAEVRPLIAAFGGVFVWLVFAEYLFNVDRLPRRAWLGPAEALLARTPWPRRAAWTTAALGLGLCAAFAGTESVPVVLSGGLFGGVAYLVSKRVAVRAKRRNDSVGLHAFAATVVFERALVIFLVFEILDGAYSLSAPGPMRAPAVQAAIAATAVAIGAVFLARLTARVDAAHGLVRLRYLRAGAAYVLGVLSVLLWVSIVTPVPGAVAAWFGSGVIGLAVLTSLPWRRLRRARRQSAAPVAEHSHPLVEPVETTRS